MTVGFGDMAQMNVSSTGTGTITLNAAVTGYQSFTASGIANNQLISYSILDASNTWEVGRGIYNNSALTLTRGPLYSSNSNGPINMTSAANVSIVVLAEDAFSFQNPTHAVLGGFI